MRRRSAPPHPRRRRLRPTPAWWREAAGIAVWSSLLIIVALWLSGRGAQNLLPSTADLLTSTGRLTGLISADLLLIQVALMARIPWVERSYGQDELARRHRLVGFWSFTLLLAHLALITVGFTLANHNDVFHETWKLLTTYAGMLLALAATLSLTLVVVTSIRRARRRLRYESWHLLHLYAYLGVGLSIPHELWTGADFLANPLARLYWWTAYLTVAGAVVVFRVGLPLWRIVRHGITVTSVVRESPDVVTVHLGGRGLHRLPVRAGQFFIWRFLDGPGWSRSARTTDRPRKHLPAGTSQYGQAHPSASQSKISEPSREGPEQLLCPTQCLLAPLVHPGPVDAGERKQRCHEEKLNSDTPWRGEGRGHQLAHAGLRGGVGALDI